MIRPIDVAWAAGIYEGEGSITYTTPAYPRVQVTQNDRWILDRLQSLFGGRVARYARSKTSWQPERYFHLWYLNGPNALGFMFTIYEFLSPHRQARFLEIYSQCDPKQNGLPSFRRQRPRYLDPSKVELL